MFIDPLSLEKINADAWKKSDMKFYDAVCNTDSDLQSFDVALRNRISKAVNSIVSGVECRSVSFGSINDAISSILDMNHDVSIAILENKKDIWKNRQLFLHVDDYFKSSLQTLDFCTSLEKCLNRYHTNLSLLDLALQHFFDKEHSESMDGTKHSRILDELNNYKAAEVSFTEDLFALFESVHHQQVLMLEKLHQRKGKINRKLKSMKTWRRISNIILASVIATLLICSVVAVVSAPPLLAAIVAALTVPFDAAGRWFTSMWKKYKDTVLREKEIVKLMELDTCLTIKDLSNIRAAVDFLLIKMESIVAVADMRMREEEGVKNAVDEMRKNVGVCIETVVDLGHRADKCNRVVGRARRVVLHRIIRHQSF